MNKDSRLVCLFLISAFAGAGCERLPENLDRDEVLRAFGQVPTQEQRAKPEAATHRIKLSLYLDSAESLTGFANVADSAYNTVLDTLVARAHQEGYELDIFRLSDKFRTTRVEIPVVDSRNYFGGDRFSLQDLLSQLARGVRNGPTIVISDLVQPSPPQRDRALERSIRELADKGCRFEVLAYRSAYSGRYRVRSSAQPGRVLHVNLDGSAVEESRPFYLLVLAPSAKQLKDIVEDLLGSEFDPVETYIPSSLDIRVKANGSGLGDEARMEEEGWSVFGNLTVDVDEESGSRAWVKILAPTEADTATTRIAISLTTEAQSREDVFRVKAGGKISVAISSSRCKEARCVDAQGMKSAVETRMVKSAEPRIELSFDIPIPEPMSWDVYRLQVSPGAENLELPSWVATWSTSDDKRVAGMNRTLGLLDLLGAFNSAIGTRSLLVDLFLEVGRGS